MLAQEACIVLGEEERLQASVDRVTASLLASPLSSSAGESSRDKFLVMLGVWEDSDKKPQGELTKTASGLTMGIENWGGFLGTYAKGLENI